MLAMLSVRILGKLSQVTPAFTRWGRICSIMEYALISSRKQSLIFRKDKNVVTHINNTLLIGSNSVAENLNPNLLFT